MSQHGGVGSARVFADPKPQQVGNTFQLDAQGLSPREEEELLEVPTPRLAEPKMDLRDVIDVSKIEADRKIVFHAVGDTGEIKHRKVRGEETVVDAMVADLKGTSSPAFLFHLGDVVYFFGERKDYYPQFYDPFRAYDRPIFAIPGNHDGAVASNGRHPEHSTERSLAGFLANFCAKEPGPAEDANGIKRELMDQPGVFFTLDAPFVSIIGLYTNVLEGPGVISSRGLTSTQAIERVGAAQLAFLKSELARLKGERDAGERAVIVACHHPPASIDDTHGGSAFLTSDLDEAFTASKLWPDAVLSGHAHLYERWYHMAGGRKIPYIISGSGGYNLGEPAKVAGYPVKWPGFELEKEPIVAYGYLQLSMDMNANPAPLLTIEFKRPDGGQGDKVEVPIEKAQAAKGRA